MSKKEKRLMMNKEERIKYMGRWYLENREEILIKRKQYRIDNQKELAEKSKQYYLVHQEECKQYSLKHKKERAEYGEQWYLDNKARILKKVKKYRKDNKEKIAESKKRYYQTEEGRAVAQRGCSKRRAKEKEIISTLTAKEWLDILEKYNYCCVYCGCEFEVENMPTKDHIIPISKGGHNIKENIVPACQSCNSRKNNNILVGHLA